MNELTYWMALAHIETMFTRRKNEILVKLYQFNEGQTPNLETFFHDGEALWRNCYSLNDDEVAILSRAKETLPNHAFTLERLQEQGFQLTTIFDIHYPETLKKNLKYNSPILLYTKGNTELLKQEMVAIVGSRAASPQALMFTDSVAKMVTQQGKVVVSGYAKGVDRQALDSAVEANGTSIVVLPQGITTFGSGFNALHRWIVQGKVLVMSYFAPMAPWTTAFAMARNQVVYGLANSIYVAESSNKGGTFAGVTDGLRKGREIFVRQPEDGENNANLQIIRMGAIPVDNQGNVLGVPKVQANEYPALDFETSIASEN